MRVNQIDPTHTPEFFYPAFDTGEIDGESNPIYTYDQPHLEDTVASGKRLRKKAKGNHEQSCHLKDDGSVDVYYDDDQLIATWQIIPQYWQNDWKDYTKIPITLEVTPEGRLQCSGEQGGFSWDIDIGWTRGDSKWSIHVVAPGVLFRFKWQITFTTLGQQLIADEILKLGHEDYLGDVEDDLGIVERNVIFEPLGVNDELTVDPYLSVDEQSTTLNIKTDAAPFFEIEFDAAKGGIIDTWYQGDGGSTNYVNTTNGLFDFSVQTQAAESRSMYYSTATMTVLENNSLRVRVKFSGELADVSGYTYSIIYTVYPSGYIAMEMFFKNETGSTIDLQRVFYRTTTSTSNYPTPTCISDNGSSTPSYNSVYWFGQYESGLNSLVVAILYIDNSKAYQTGHWLSGNTAQYANNVDNTWAVDEEAHASCMMYISGSSATEADLQADIDQFHPQTASFATIVDSIGSLITDINIPGDVDSAEGVYADGGQHIDPDSTNHDAKLLINQTETNPVIILHEASIRTGDGTTEHCIGHWKCDDNAASSVITAEIGDNATWRNISDGSARNTNTSGDSVEGFRGNAFDTQNGLGYIDMPSSLKTNAFLKEGSLIIEGVPYFNYDDVSQQTIFHFEYDSNNRIFLIYNAGGDRFNFTVKWDAVAVSVDSPTYTSNAELQIPIEIHLCWSDTYNFISLWINGECIGTNINSNVPTGNNPINCNIGCWINRSTPADILTDEIKAYNAPVLPHGTLISANVENDYSDVHSDIIFVWNGSDATPIGTDVTSNGDYTQDGPIGTKAFRNDTSGEYASAATSGNISSSEGSFLFWFEPNAALGADCTLLYAASNFKVWWDDSDNDIVFTYGTETVRTTTALPAGDTNVHAVRIGWDASKEIYIKRDGIIDINTTSIPSAPTLDATMYFTADDSSGTNRANVMMSDVQSSNKKGTPELPVVLGVGPIVKPKLYKNGTLQQSGDGHQIIWTP